MPSPIAFPGLQRDEAERFAALPLANLAREYPNHLSHLLRGPDDARTPRDLHPIFYGCYDWHSAAHGYWLLARCLRLFPDLAARGAIERHFAAHLRPELGEREAAYFREAGRGTFERPYGWGWLLALVAELGRLEGAAAAGWRAALAPLAGFLRDACLAHLDRLPVPVRAGTHGNTAFGLLLALDYAERCGDEALAGAVAGGARRLYAADRDYPLHYEPGGDDFLSGGLVEAVLMARALPAAAFPAWLKAFLPAADLGGLAVAPLAAIDRADAKTVHLDGLNLSRAWCLRSLADTLPASAPARGAFAALAEAHEAASLPHLEGDYVGEHWLATFAALARGGL